MSTNTRTPSRIAVIGSGFAGLSAASVLAAKGNDVTIYEKNASVGGRARVFSADGFTFDMGPSWYWMPEVFERFYNQFGFTTSDFYELKRLDPGFTVVFGKDNVVNVPSDFDALCELFESIEKGSAAKLKKFLDDAGVKYKLGMDKLVYQPAASIFEFMNYDVLKGMLTRNVFSSFSQHVSSYFKDPRLVALMEFPVLFLGAMPSDTPALYSLMNYAGLKLGTWYPMGGFGKAVDAFKTIADKHGVTTHTAEAVQKLEVNSNNVTRVSANGHSKNVDAVIGAADYHHIESALLNSEERSYTEKYWDAKTFAPSCLIFYIGVNRRIDKLNHHTLFFDEDFNQHARDIYKDKRWPTKPLFYVCAPSKTDSTVAPEGSENLFVLMPVASGLVDSNEINERYYDLLMKRLEDYAGHDIRSHVVFKKDYSVSDFTKDYNAYKGNAYGLANTLFQTAMFKPKMQSKKIRNLFFAGQLTVPGPGVPPSIISGQVAAEQLMKHLKR